MYCFDLFTLLFRAKSPTKLYPARCNKKTASVIISVNEAWRKFAEANGLSRDDYGAGRSYLKVCEFAEGDNAIESRAAFKGIILSTIV